MEYLLAKHVRTAAKMCPSLANKRVTPHVLRHTTAMEFLQAGVNRSVIALLLGHESVETTQIYLDANLAMKEQALAKAAPPSGNAGRYHPEDQLLAFLKGLWVGTIKRLCRPKMPFGAGKVAGSVLPALHKPLVGIIRDSA